MRKVDQLAMFGNNTYFEGYGLSASTDPRRPDPPVHQLGIKSAGAQRRGRPLVAALMADGGHEQIARQLFTTASFSRPSFGIQVCYFITWDRAERFDQAEAAGTPVLDIVACGTLSDG